MRRVSMRAPAVAAALLLAGGPLYAQTPVAPPAAAPNQPEIRAQLTPRDFTTLSAEMAGRIDKIARRVGEHFNAGDTLVVFDCAVQRAQVARAQAVVLQTERTYTSNQRLAQLRSVGQVELEVSRGEVEKSKADLAIAQATASKCAITAPYSGVVVDQKAQQYQFATPGQPLLDILDDSRLEIELIAPSSWLAWLKVGLPFQIHIDATNKTYPAKVTRLGGRVDPVSESIKLIGEITTPAPELVAGMSGRVIVSPP